MLLQCLKKTNHKVRSVNSIWFILISSIFSEELSVGKKLKKLLFSWKCSIYSMLHEKQNIKAWNHLLLLIKLNHCEHKVKTAADIDVYFNL